MTNFAAGKVGEGEIMNVPRRQFLHLAAGAIVPPAISRTASAQSYPSRPIRLVVPFPPGGAFDTLGRPLADKIKLLLGTMVIENIGGGGSSLGASAVAHAPPDGYTILLGGTLPHVNEALLKSRPLYDPIRDLDPISNVAFNFSALLCTHRCRCKPSNSSSITQKPIQASCPMGMSASAQ
jgi:tripartite-type tricarboxylate transporter receptor subunit TctC